MRSILSVLNFLGSLLLLFALYFVPPIATAAANGEHALVGFLAGAGVSGALGLLLRAATWRYHGTLKPRDGYLLVSAIWPVIAAVATIPLLLVLASASPTRSWTMSGVSTTRPRCSPGRRPAALRDAVAPVALLAGGMSVIVLAVAVLPLLGIGGMQIHQAGAPGGIKHFRSRHESPRPRGCCGLCGADRSPLRGLGRRRRPRRAMPRAIDAHSAASPPRRQHRLVRLAADRVGAA
jgi:trk system potassium uptake protein TrkH